MLKILADAAVNLKPEFVRLHNFNASFNRIRIRNEKVLKYQNCFNFSKRFETFEKFSKRQLGL